MGLKLSLFLSVIFLSGTLAVVSNEIDWLVDPAMRASPAAGSAATWGTIASNALIAVPGGRIDLIERGPDPWFATTVVLRATDGHRRRVLVDPATGRVNRVAGFGSVERFLRDFHRRLMLPVAIGIPLVTSFAFVNFASLVTGLVTYRKFWRGFFRRPRFHRDARTISGDLHRLAGIWSLWFLSLMVMTSLWYLVELLGAGAPPTLPLRAVDKAKSAVVLPQPVGGELDRLSERARLAYPQLEVTRVQYPFPGVTSVGFQGMAGTLLTTEKANAVWIEPGTGTVDMKVIGSELSARQRIAEMADPVHFGTFGGLWTKLIWFIFGLFVSALSITGAVIYVTRLRGEGGKSAKVLAKGISWWAMPALGLIFYALWLTPTILRG
jgi:uncharacterized iron-regulated membrane protein